MTIIGPSTAGASESEVRAGSQNAQATGPFTVVADATVVALGATLRKGGSGAGAVLCLWSVANGRPDLLLARTTKVALTSTPARVEAPVTVPVTLRAGEPVALGVHVTSGSVRVASAVSGSGTLWWDTQKNVPVPAVTRHQADGSATAAPFAVYASTGDPVTDAAARVPALVSPANGERVTAAPDLVFLLLDATGQGVPGASLGGFVQIRPDGGSVATQTAATWDAANGVFRLPSAPWVVGPGRWEWRAAPNPLPDASERWWSDWRGLTLVAGPSLTIGYPAADGVISTVAPSIQWSVAGGTPQRARVRVVSLQTRATLCDSGWLGGDVAAWTVPAGCLGSGGSYEAEVTVDTGTGPVTLRRTFRVTHRLFAAPAAFAVANVALPGDMEPSTPRLTWAASGLPPSEFAGYVVTRRLAAQSADEAVPVAWIRTQAQTTVWDTAAPGNADLVYGVATLRRNGGAIEQSTVAEASARVDLRVPTLASVENGALVRIALTVLSDGLGGTFSRPETTASTWGSSGRPTVISTPNAYGARHWDADFRLHGIGDLTAGERLAAVQALVLSGDVCCLRTETTRAFVTVADWSWKRGGVGTFDVSLSLQEVAYEEGVTVTP